MYIFYIYMMGQNDGIMLAHTYTCGVKGYVFEPNV